MLVLSRFVGERIIVGDGLCVITVVAIRGNKIRIGVDAPPSLAVHREEIQDRIHDEKRLLKKGKGRTEYGQHNDTEKHSSEGVGGRSSGVVDTESRPDGCS